MQISGSWSILVHVLIFVLMKTNAQILILVKFLTISPKVHESVKFLETVIKGKKMTDQNCHQPKFNIIL